MTRFDLYVKKLGIILILLSILISVCAFGFIIGGEKGAAFYFLFGALSLVISFAITAFINGKKYAAGAWRSKAVIALAIGIFIICTILYNPMNGFTKGSDFIEYEAEITRVSAYRAEPIRIYFNDSQGNERSVWDLYGNIVSDDERMPVEGKIINIREYEGGFGFPHYDWTDIHEKEE